MAINKRKQKGLEKKLNLKIRKRMALKMYKDSVKIALHAEEDIKEGKALEAKKQKTISTSTDFNPN